MTTAIFPSRFWVEEVAFIQIGAEFTRSGDSNTVVVITNHVDVTLRLLRSEPGVRVDQRGFYGLSTVEMDGTGITTQ